LFTMFCKFAAISDCYICLSVAFKPFLFLLIAEGTNLPTDNWPGRKISTSSSHQDAKVPQALHITRQIYAPFYYYCIKRQPCLDV
jgi:hypothetical protein